MDKSHKVKLDIAKTRHQQEPLLDDALALARALYFAKLNADGRFGKRSTYRIARLSKFVDSVGQGIK